MNLSRDSWLKSVQEDSSLDTYAQAAARAVASMVTGLSPVSYASVHLLTEVTGLDRQTVLDAIEDLREAGWLAEHRVRVYSGGGGFTLTTLDRTDDFEEAA